MKPYLNRTLFLVAVWCFSMSSAFAYLSPIQGQNMVEPGQGGDTIENALEISLPFSGSGTTVGYSNDYDVACPWGAYAPDVVYSFFPSEDIDIVVDLWGSDYDTKLFIYDENTQPVACNDDYYENWVSRLEMVTLSAGIGYYIVVDGLDNYSGNYEIQVYANQLQIPPNAVPEGEPTLYYGYVDVFNSGCNFSVDEPLVQEIFGNDSGELDLHGHTGWLDVDSYSVDTDWFSLAIGETGTVNIDFISQLETRLAQLEPLDCNSVGVGQSVVAMVDSPVSMTVIGPPFSIAWVAVFPEFIIPSGFTQSEYSYLLSVSGLQEGPVATEQVSWGAVKSLYR